MEAYSSHSTTCDARPEETESETRGWRRRRTDGARVEFWRGGERARTVPSMRRKGRPMPCAIACHAHTCTPSLGSRPKAYAAYPIAVWSIGTRHRSAHRVPLLRLLLDEVVDGVAQLGVLAGVRVCVQFGAVAGERKKTRSGVKAQNVRTVGVRRGVYRESGLRANTQTYTQTMSTPTTTTSIGVGVEGRRRAQVAAWWSL
jgi:hypothetical protein